MTKLTMAAVLALTTFAPTAFAASVKTYQVTGPVVETTADKIVVMKGKDKWELAKDASTKVSGDVQPGTKVTIQYTMTATEIAASAAKGAAKSSKKSAAH